MNRKQLIKMFKEYGIKKTYIYIYIYIYIYVTIHTDVNLSYEFNIET